MAKSALLSVFGALGGIVPSQIKAVIRYEVLGQPNKPQTVVESDTPKELRLCKDCGFYVDHHDFGERCGKVGHLTKSPVDAKPEWEGNHCSTERIFGGDCCGPEGRLWIPRIAIQD